MSVFSLKIDIADNKFFNGETSPLFSQSQAKLARQFHQKIAGYRPTPLCALDDLANLFGVKKILVKDESKRFGLNAFKMLGGAYAIAQLLCEKYHLDIETLSFEHLKNAIGEKMTFATTTDGNHGRGVAWAAQQLGQNAVIYMPKGSAQERVDAILNLGAECIVTDMNYDDTVRLTMQHAQQHGWEVVQDTAWEGYTKIPTWIMQGYATLADEAVEQMREMGVTPTHVLLQAGVGAMAGGVLGYLVDVYSPQNLHSIIVEPDKADCIYRSGVKGDIVNVGGDMATIMAGLACGEPNPLGWEILRNCATQFISCQDSVAALGMRVLGNPYGNDPRIISGESGAVGLGVLAAVHYHPQRQSLMEKLALNKDAVVLVISTEATSWRIQQITRDQVIVTPAPGRSARLPFWRGEGNGRPAELGEMIGDFLHLLADGAFFSGTIPPWLAEENTIANIQGLIEEQRNATGIVPGSRHLVLERCRDEIGDWRIILHSPYGRRVHEPWAVAIAGRIHALWGADASVVASDDGIVARIPDTDGKLPDAAIFLFEPEKLATPT